MVTEKKTDIIDSGELSKLREKIAKLEAELRLHEARLEPSSSPGETVPAACAEGESASVATSEIERRLSQLEETNRQLGASEARFRGVFQGAALGIAISDPHGYLEAVNPAAERLFGYTAEELEGRHFLSLTHPADAAVSEDRFQALLDGEIPYLRLKKRYICKDGSWIWGQITLSLVRDDDGRPAFLTGMLRDITEQVQLEDERLRSEARVSGILESSHDAIVSIDEEQRIVLFNPAAERIFGYSSEEVVGQPLDLLIPEEHVQDHHQSVEKVLKEELDEPVDGQRLEIRGRRKDGSIFPAESSISRLPLPDGVLMTAVVRDVTEQRKLEYRSRQMQKMEALGRLAGGVAHDFNNLLVGILLNAELLQTEMDAESSSQARVNEILACAQKASDLTRQLLLFSRKKAARPEEQSVSRILDDLKEMLPRLIGEDIELIVAVQPDTGTVALGPGQLEQVIFNLAFNARDAMPGGGKLSIRARNEEIKEPRMGKNSWLDPGPYVALEVSDTGSGMDAETQAHIFEPFFTTKEETKGTGLGLSTAFAIVEQVDGYIECDSRPGKGTVFTLHLPRTPIDGESLATPEAAPIQMRQGTETILVVEDEDVVRRITSEILELSGYNVLAARNGGEALLILENQERAVDLLLSDVVMPHMSGGQLAERVAKERPEMKILFMSGYPDDALVQHGLDDNRAALLQKPFTPEALTSRIREILDTRQK